jgi:hypothetical protein
VAKKKKKSFVKKGATIGACPAPPPVPPVPPSPPPPPAVCPGKTACAGLCCDQCCLPIPGSTDPEDRCAGPASVHTCCPASQGGGFCDVGEKCCPPTEQEPIGTCGDSLTAVCCDSDHGGGWCPSGATCCAGGGCEAAGVSECCPEEDGGGSCDVEFPACCPEDLGFSCCEVLGDCCIEGETDCGVDRTCVVDNELGGGCCVDDNPVLRTREKSPRRLGQNSVKSKKRRE